MTGVRAVGRTGAVDAGIPAVTWGFAPLNRLPKERDESSFCAVMAFPGLPDSPPVGTPGVKHAV